MKKKDDRQAQAELKSVDDGMERLGKRIAELRQKRNLSQTELASKIGVSQSTIAQIETGRNDPSVTTLRKIAAGLGLNVAVLFSSENTFVFDMKEMNKKYRHYDDLSENLKAAFFQINQFMKKIGIQT
jgi:transcriptional regulator with XRE-family HTH domain